MTAIGMAVPTETETKIETETEIAATIKTA